MTESARSVRPNPRLLFLNQGRTSDVGVMGHLQAEAALQRWLPSEALEGAMFEHLRRWTPAERVMKKRFPMLQGRDAGVARWLLLRSLATRRHLMDAAVRGIGRAHITTHAVALLLDQRMLANVTLSVDTTLWSWQVLLRGLPDNTPPSGDMALPLRLERRAFKGAGLVQAWTSTVADDIRRVAPTANVVVHHPGVDVTLFRPGRRKEGRIKVLFVGGRFEAKGGLDLIEALRPRLGRDVVLEVVTPTQVDAPAGVTVKRLEARSQELCEAFRTADVFCLPSRADAVPWVVLEAMASGTPVVAYDVGSVAEMVGNAGLVVPRGDQRALRQALDHLLDHSEARRQAGLAARARAESHYDARVQAPRLLEMVRETGLGGVAQRSDGR